MNVVGHWTFSGSVVVVVVVVSVDADEVALRRGIVIFGIGGRGALRKKATTTAETTAVKKRGKARMKLRRVTVKAVARGARGRKKAMT